MNIFGALLKEEEIIGITRITEHMRTNPSEFQLSFKIITKSSSMEFASRMIEDFHIATPIEQQELQDFRAEYAHVRKTVARVLGHNDLVQELHSVSVRSSFGEIVEGHRLLEEAIAASKSKSKKEWLQLLQSVRPHIIKLRKLAEC